MADIESQQVNHRDLPGKSCSRSVLPQQQNHVLHDARIPSAGQLEGQWDDIPPDVRVGHGAMQSTMQNLHHIDYGMGDYQDPSRDLAGPYAYPNSNVGLAQERVQVTFYEEQGNGSFGYVPQGVVPGPSPGQAAFPDPPSGHRAPTLGRPVAENLRRLASRYVHHPDSQVEMVRMEPGSAGRNKVVIVLEMADFL